MVDILAEFLGDGLGVTGMAVGGYLLGLDLGEVTDLAERRNALAAARSRVSLRCPPEPPERVKVTTSGLAHPRCWLWAGA